MAIWKYTSWNGFLTYDDPAPRAGGKIVSNRSFRSFRNWRAQAASENRIGATSFAPWQRRNTALRIPGDELFSIICAHSFFGCGPGFAPESAPANDNERYDVVSEMDGKVLHALFGRKPS